MILEYLYTFKEDLEDKKKIHEINYEAIKMETEHIVEEIRESDYKNL